jgi:hypothetical protein
LGCGCGRVSSQTGGKAPRTLFAGDEGLAALDFGFASSICFRDQPVL